jgi:hypothetical protein
MVVLPDINRNDDCTQSDSDNSDSFVICVITSN